MKNLIISLLAIVCFASCKIDNNYPLCEKFGYCRGHLETRYSTITYCAGLPHGLDAAHLTK